MEYSEILQNLLEYGQKKYSDVHHSRHAAFANSCAYLVTGMSGGYGGPSVREHCVTWLAIAAKEKMAGQWPVDKAIAFAEPICYGELPLIANQVCENESCFDDDPADLERLGKS
jgi:hypothetical protein